jgi:hypothetical protein
LIIKEKYMANQIEALRHQALAAIDTYCEDQDARLSDIVRYIQERGASHSAYMLNAQHLLHDIFPAAEREVGLAIDCYRVISSHLRAIAEGFDTPDRPHLPSPPTQAQRAQIQARIEQEWPRERENLLAEVREIPPDHDDLVNILHDIAESFVEKANLGYRVNGYIDTSEFIQDIRYRLLEVHRALQAAPKVDAPPPQPPEEA